MDKIYQTIIIGAGPAGLIAGQYLEDALILDKKEEIGKPIQCGEGLSQKALEFQEIEPDPSWISSEIHKIERITPNGKVIGRFHEEIMGYILDKAAFEKFLFNKCKARIQLNNQVVELESENGLWKVKTENGQVLRSNYLIGADGVYSIVRKKIFPEQQEKMEFLSAIEYLVETEKEFDTKTMKVYLDNEKYPQGYAWIFPKSENRANIGVGGKGNLLEKFNEFSEKIVRENYGGYRLLENKSGVIPLNNSQLKILKEKAMLVGDAAGLADPLFKGGTNQAMYSAKIAAECILRNEVALYESKIKAMPFADPQLIEMSRIFFSFENEVLDELGEVLESKGTSYSKTVPGIFEIISKPYLRKSFYKIFKFFTIWRKNRDYLW